MTKMKTLPVPKLSETRDELIEWVKPFLLPNELKSSLEEINSFFLQSPEGEKLQEKLLLWDSQAKTNWLTPLWNESYLSYPDKLHSGLSYHMVLTNKHFVQNNRIELVAQTLQKATAYYHSILEKQASSTQHAKLFKATRIPNKQDDSYHIGQQSTINNFVILSHLNLHYKIFVSDQAGKLISTRHLTEQIRKIKENQKQADLSVNYLTSTDRAHAFELYQEIKQTNQTSLDTIANALFFFHLDQSSNTALDALKSAFLNTQDKYYDKSLQFGFNKNNSISLSIEHTYVDATTVLPLIDFLYETEIQASLISSQRPDFEILSYELTDFVLAKLSDIKEQNKQEFNLYQVNELRLTQVNAAEIKAARFSPDAFFQMALQIAQYKTFKTVKSTYEPVAMTDYIGGRTECIRPVTNESIELVRRYVMKESDALIFEQMNQAASEHKRRIIKCLNGQGVERHLFGLESMYEHYGDELKLETKPPIFSDYGIKQLTTDFLSTTNVTHERIENFIFGPVIEGGFGIYYSLLDNELIVNISSAISNPSDLFIKELEQALINLLKIAKKAAPKN